MCCSLIVLAIRCGCATALMRRSVTDAPWRGDAGPGTDVPWRGDGRLSADAPGHGDAGRGYPKKAQGGLPLFGDIERFRWDFSTPYHNN